MGTPPADITRLKQQAPAQVPAGEPGPAVVAAAASAKSDAKLVLNLSARATRMHPYQAYMHMYTERVMPVVKEEWEYYQTHCDDEDKMPMMA